MVRRLLALALAASVLFGLGSPDAPTAGAGADVSGTPGAGHGAKGRHAHAGGGLHGEVHRSVTTHPKERSCSKSMGVTTDQEMCVSLMLRFGRLTAASLLHELVDVEGGVDANFLIRRVHISTHDVDPLAINTALDAFLETRPWWLIRKETILGLEQDFHRNLTAEDIVAEVINRSGPWASGGAGSHSGGSAHFVNGIGNAGGGGGGNPRLSHIFLQRYEQKMEAHLHQIAAVQFPPSQAECASSRMRLSHTVKSGWGSASAFYGIFVTDHPWAVFAPWESNTNLPGEAVMYANPDLCPTVVNKWLCAFMPATNCTLPDEATKCGVPGSGQPATCNYDGELLYTEATAKGHKLSEEQRKTLPDMTDQHKAHSDYHKGVAEWYDKHKGDDFISQERVVNNKLQPLDHRAADRWLVIKVFGQIWRPNAVYRTLISRRIKLMWREMFEKYQLPPLNEETSECTAIHIRRGDRSVDLEGQAMRDWCDQWLPFTTWDNCTSKKTGQKQSCQGLSDYGCFHPNPFGALTLQDYLDAAWSIHKTRNIFVLTDAQAWLQRQRATVNASWSIYSIASDGSKDRANSAPRATMNGVEYHASIRMAQTCQAFVGHWGSGVSHMVRNAMCFRHGNTALAQCPKVVDMQMLYDLV